MPAAFAIATAVDPQGDGRYAASIDTSWSAPLGPNGGYLAAIVLRALAAEVSDPAKQPRSLTCHYLRPPAEGPVEITVTREREGRTVASLTAQVHQGGKLCLLAIAAFGSDLPSALDYDEAVMPDVPAAATIEPWPWAPPAPPIIGRMEIRPALGDAPFSGSPHAVTGGWLSMREPYPADAFALAQYTDAWLPAPFSRLDAPAAAPTIDLTIHFRQTLPAAGEDPLAPVFIEVTSDVSANGYFEEDTRVWSPGGVLLAQSRQLALLRPLA